MTSWDPEKLQEYRERNSRNLVGRATLFHGPKTIDVVAMAIRGSGVQETQTQEIIQNLLNSGIVFREIK